MPGKRFLTSSKMHKEHQTPIQRFFAEQIFGVMRNFFLLVYSLSEKYDY